MRILTFLFVLFLCGAACSGGDGRRGAGAGPERSEPARAAIEARLIGELSPGNDRAARERNALINRAIDGNFDVYPAPEGYFYEILSPGQFNPLRENDHVAAHYSGYFLDGRVFDDSRRRNEKLRFYVGQLIPAWNLALLRVRPGASLRLLVPSALAYGAAGLAAPNGDTLVPAHTPLEFLIEEVELLED